MQRLKGYLYKGKKRKERQNKGCFGSVLWSFLGVCMVGESPQKRLKTWQFWQPQV